MSKKLNRREFIKISGVGACGLTLGGSLLTSSCNHKMAPIGSDDVIEKTPNYCEICFYGCAEWVYKKNGKPWKIEANAIDQHSYGRLCTRGSGGLGAYTDPDRLKKPLLRVNVTDKKGRVIGQKFEEVSWSKALDFITKKMSAIKAEHGAESLAFISHGSGAGYFKDLMKAYGSNELSHPSYDQCRGARDDAYLYTVGHGLGSPELTDIKNSKCMVLIGSHIGENIHRTQTQEFGEFLKNKGLLITVDPRYSVAASKAKYWLPIKPGTDVALLLAWIYVIITENLYNRPYVDQNTFGFDELKRVIVEENKDTPKWASQITTISEEKIIETAREMAKHAPNTLIHGGRHNSWYGDDFQRSRANLILNVLLGSYGSPGGIFKNVSNVKLGKYPHPPYPKTENKGLNASRQLYPLATSLPTKFVRDASLPGSDLGHSYKGWIVYQCNLPLTLPDRQKTEQAIQNLDLLVALDIIPSEIAGYADVVLPDTSYLERHDLVRNKGWRKKQLAVRVPAFKPVGESRPSWWIAKELALRLNLKEYFKWAKDNSEADKANFDTQQIESYINTQLQVAGTSLDEMIKLGVKDYGDNEIYLQPDETVKTWLPSKKIELYSNKLEELAELNPNYQKEMSPVPVYIEKQQPPKNYYRLLHGRSPAHSFSRTTNNPLLTQLVPENEIWINADVAKEWGISNGQYVILKNQDGIKSNKIKAKVTEMIRGDCVYMVHGFGRLNPALKRSYMKGANTSDLMTNEPTDPTMGSTGHYSNFITFEV